MARRQPSPEEIEERARFLQVVEWSGKDRTKLSLEMGWGKQLISNVEHHGRRIEPEMLRQLAKHAAGHGRLAEFEEAKVLDHLNQRITIEDQLRVAASFDLAPSEGRGLLMIFRQRLAQMAPSMAA